jgi:hypothetical protein
MATERHLSDPFKLPGGNIDTSGKLPGQLGYNSNSQVNYQYTVDIPTEEGQKKGTNPNNPVSIFRKGISQPIGNITSQGGFNPNPAYYAGVSAAEEKIRKAEQRAVRTQTIPINKQVIVPTAKKSNIDPPVTSNAATTQTGAGTSTPSAGLTAESLNTFNQVNVYVEGTRTKYPKEPLRYPLKLDPKNQDHIKFTIQQYTPSGLNVAKYNPRKIANSTSLVDIILPIPGGISDRNTVDWQSGNLSVIDKAAGSIAQGTIFDGTKGATDAASNVGKIIAGNQKEIEAIAGIKMAEQAVSGLTGSSVDLMSREFGAVLNPNMELLFSGPQLRDFSFIFRMSPREPQEAQRIREIIRCFKQAMSAKRSKSNLLLKTPHTFLISYINAEKGDHPYLNKFKECALTSCSVNYTPDGTYMTYDGEPSMTCYELSLTFQELAPIFDDDYGTEEPITNIGY